MSQKKKIVEPRYKAVEEINENLEEYKKQHKENKILLQQLKDS